MSSRIDKYRSMLSSITDAQKCAYKCAWTSGCSTCWVRSPMNRAKGLARELGETSIYNILENIDRNYDEWSWRNISHEMTNAKNAIKSAARAAESQSAADINRAEAHRKYAVTTGVQAKQAARQRADAQIAAREAEARAKAARDAEARRLAEAQAAAARARQEEAAKAEAARRAQAEKQRAEAAAARRKAEEADARRRGDLAAARAAAAAAAEEKRKAQLAERQAREAQQKAQAARKQQEQARKAQDEFTGKEFRNVAEGIASILNPLATAGTNIFAAQQQAGIERQRLRSQLTPTPIMPMSIPQPTQSNTGLIIGGIAVGTVVLIGLVVALR